MYIFFFFCSFVYCRGMSSLYSIDHLSRNVFVLQYLGRSRDEKKKPSVRICSVTEYAINVIKLKCN